MKREIGDLTDEVRYVVYRKKTQEEDLNFNSEAPRVIKLERIKLILETFVDMGEILMYPNIPELKDLIITQPTSFIQGVLCLVRHDLEEFLVESHEADVEKEIHEKALLINKSIIKMKELHQGAKSKEYFDLKEMIKSMSSLCDPDPVLGNISKTGFVTTDMFTKLYNSKVSKDNHDHSPIEEEVLKSLLINLKLASKHGNKLFVPILISGNSEQGMKIKKKQIEFEENRSSFHLHMKTSDEKSSSELFTVLCTELTKSTDFKLCYSRRMEDRKREDLVSGIIGSIPDMGIKEYLFVQNTVASKDNFFSYCNNLDIYFQYDNEEYEEIAKVQEYFRGIINQCLECEENGKVPEPTKGSQRSRLEIKLRREKYGKRISTITDENNTAIFLTLPLKKSSLQFMLEHKKFIDGNERKRWLLEQMDFTWLDLMFDTDSYSFKGQGEFFDKEFNAILEEGKIHLEKSKVESTETVKKMMEMIDENCIKVRIVFLLITFIYIFVPKECNSMEKKLEEENSADSRLEEIINTLQSSKIYSNGELTTFEQAFSVEAVKETNSRKHPLTRMDQSCLHFSGSTTRNVSEVIDCLNDQLMSSLPKITIHRSNGNLHGTMEATNVSGPSSVQTEFYIIGLDEAQTQLEKQTHIFL